jgi:hypothetical protein
LSACRLILFIFGRGSPADFLLDIGKETIDIRPAVARLGHGVVESFEYWCDRAMV